MQTSRSANLAEMTNMGLPVPPGFVITTEACGVYLKSGVEPPEMAAQVGEQLGRRFTGRDPGPHGCSAADRNAKPLTGGGSSPT